jgi:hypothetical protein
MTPRAATAWPDDDVILYDECFIPDASLRARVIE